MADIPAQVSDIIDDILDNFDFGRVFTVMNALDWKLVDDKDFNDTSIPTLGRMYRKAKSLLINSYINNSDGTCSTTSGGFRAECLFDDENEVRFRLAFVVTDYDNFD